MHQLPLSPGRGGYRAGSGRKPKGDRAGVVHRSRRAVSRYHPIHITNKVLDSVPSLRGAESWAAIRRSLAAGCRRDGFRVVEFSVMADHLHLLCEAEDRRALSRGLQGLFVRMARAINRSNGSKGRVFSDRYDDRILTSPVAVREALVRILNDFRFHAARSGRQLAPEWIDPYSSAARFHGASEPEDSALTVTPQSWLLRRGYLDAGPVTIAETPPPCSTV